MGGVVGPSVDGTVYEIALVVMSSYLAYLLAEVARLSGIVALFFTGKDLRHVISCPVPPGQQYCCFHRNCTCMVPFTGGMS